MTVVGRVALWLAVACAGACADPPVDDPPRAAAAAARAAMDRLTREGLAGRDLYGRYCEVCHGLSGAGDGFNADRLPEPPPPFTVRSPQLGGHGIRLHVDRGSGGAFAPSACPPYGGNLTANERRILTRYVMTLGSSIDSEQ